MLRIARLSVDYMDCPLGITENPQFGWIIESDRSNIIQETYHLQISRASCFHPLAYDSGEVRSNRSAHVRADGLTLESSTAYFVRVRITDGHEESSWSDVVGFTTALLDNSLWKGQFISAESPADSVSSKGTYLRHRFTLTAPVASALVHTSALGLYTLHLNGQKVSCDELTPGWTSYAKHLAYQTYDVTALLKGGENVIGAMVGAGWYKGTMGLAHARNLYGTQTALLCQMEITFLDGTKTMIISDETWKGHDAPILFSEIYDGEIYDARQEMDGWDNPGFKDNDWKPVSVLAHDYSSLISQPGSKVRENERISAIALLKTPQGDTVIDFGQNLSGWVCFRVRGNAGDRVTFRHFETLDSQGNVYLANLRGAAQRIQYTLRGGVNETYRPHFSFHGFRYLHIEEWPGEINLGDFEAIAVHSHMRRVGTFECSNPLVNQLHHNIVWGLKSNFVDVPTDCPQRDERLGWTGDAQIFCRTACYLMDAYAFYHKWLVDVRADQLEDGGVPHVVPDILTGNFNNDGFLGQGTDSAAAWADVAVILPWTLYLMYGDTNVLKEQYHSMKAWIDFMRRHAHGAHWDYRLQFGDWVALDAAEGSYFGATPNEFIASAYYAYSTGLFAKAAKILGYEADYEEYQSLYQCIVAGFQRAFFTGDGSMTVRTQTAHAVALYFNLVPDCFKATVTQDLLGLLKEHGGHLVTGFVGTPYLCHALSQNGCVEEAYDLLLREDLPSWLYQVKAGATTIWEHWDGIKPDGTMWSPDMNSFNHYAYGAIGEWLYRAVGGLEVDESNAGFQHAFIRPCISRRLEYVKASYIGVYGDISVSWRRVERRILLDVTIPHNTTATIMLVPGVSEIVSPVPFIETAEGSRIEIGSGIYSLSFHELIPD
jgi:alpha-L-rhamnosidase